MYDSRWLPLLIFDAERFGALNLGGNLGAGKDDDDDDDDDEGEDAEAVFESGREEHHAKGHATSTLEHSLPPFSLEYYKKVRHLCRSTLNSFFKSSNRR